MSDGIFIVAIVSILIGDTRKKLISFLKIDFTTVYQQQRTTVQGRHIVSLTRIIDSLADTPKALQKWAILDPGTTFNWDVIALQRGKNNNLKDTNEAIPSYFRNFLQVMAKDTPSSLTKKTVSQTTDWSKDSAQLLPEHIKRTDIKARSISYFDTAMNFDTNNYLDHVLGSFIPLELRDDNLSQEQQQRKDYFLQLQTDCKTSLLEKLDNSEISGQVFECRPNSIPSSERRNKIITSENVTIQFKGEFYDNHISIDTVDNEQIITIRTTHYRYD